MNWMNRYKKASYEEVIINGIGVCVFFDGFRIGFEVDFDRSGKIGDRG